MSNDNAFRAAQRAYDNQLPPDYYEETCNVCEGTGETLEREDCPSCEGVGVVKPSRRK